ncbi:hypothetical protein Cp1R7AA1_051 [Mesorhizobium phage Cp1R7A-A1]|nr:hypothetical protein Cp1R7AA1_051 [Mesorhizobium phage Cp1R7A-A1]
MEDVKTFTLYWRTGQREIVKGSDPADAMNKAGYGAGAVRALDFYANGEDTDYAWDKETRDWKRTVPLT